MRGRRLYTALSTAVLLIFLLGLLILSGSDVGDEAGGWRIPPILFTAFLFTAGVGMGTFRSRGRWRAFMALFWLVLAVAPAYLIWWESMRDARESALFSRDYTSDDEIAEIASYYTRHDESRAEHLSDLKARAEFAMARHRFVQAQDATETRKWWQSALTFLLPSLLPLVLLWWTLRLSDEDVKASGAVW